MTRDNGYENSYHIIINLWYKYLIQWYKTAFSLDQCPGLDLMRKEESGEESSAYMNMIILSISLRM